MIGDGKRRPWPRIVATDGETVASPVRDIGAHFDDWSGDRHGPTELLPPYRRDPIDWWVVLALAASAACVLCVIGFGVAVVRMVGAG